MFGTCVFVYQSYFKFMFKLFTKQFSNLTINNMLIHVLRRELKKFRLRLFY